MINNLYEILKKLRRVLESTLLSNFVAKIEAAHALRLLAEKLNDVADIVIQYYESDVLKALGVAATDRVPKVQLAAQDAKKAWERLREKSKFVGPPNAINESPEKALQDRLGIPSNPKKLSKFGIIRQMVKLQKGPKQTRDTQKVADVLSRWQSALHAGKFLKRGMGLGGGFVPLPPIDQTSNSIKKRPKERQSIKKLILQYAMGKAKAGENFVLDKFGRNIPEANKETRLTEKVQENLELKVLKNTKEDEIKQGKERGVESKKVQVIKREDEVVYEKRDDICEINKTQCKQKEGAQNNKIEIFKEENAIAERTGRPQPLSIERGKEDKNEPFAEDLHKEETNQKLFEDETPIQETAHFIDAVSSAKEENNKSEDIEHPYTSIENKNKLHIPNIGTSQYEESPKTVIVPEPKPLAFKEESDVGVEPVKKTALDMGNSVNYQAIKPQAKPKLLEEVESALKKEEPEDVDIDVDNSMPEIIASEMKGDFATEMRGSSAHKPNEDVLSKHEEDVVPEYKQSKAPEYKENTVTEYKQNKVPEYKENTVSEYKQKKVPEYKENTVTEQKQSKVPEYKENTVTEQKQSKVLEYKGSTVSECKEDTKFECERNTEIVYKENVEAEHKEHAIPKLERDPMPYIDEYYAGECEEKPAPVFNDNPTLEMEECNETERFSVVKRPALKGNVLHNLNPREPSEDVLTDAIDHFQDKEASPITDLSATLPNTTRGLDTETSEIEDIHQNYVDAVKRMNTGKVESAITSLLNNGDDLYFLKLLFQLHPTATQNIRKTTMESMLERLNGIIRGETVQTTHLQWIEDSVNTGKFWRFSKETQNELLDTLYTMRQSKGEIGTKAAGVYKKVMHILSLAKHG